MSELRQLEFMTLDEAVVEAKALLRFGYERRGNWSLGQICQHLCLVQDPSVEGYPPWMSLFAPARPLMRRWLLPKLLQPELQIRVSTASAFVPTNDASDELEVVAFEASVSRLLAADKPFYPHPAFGRLPNEQIRRVHSAHAAHHMRFLEPRSSAQCE
ncbi:MAG: DUF1569 domain-containing protein [Planctomycetota bacterium]